MKDVLGPRGVVGKSIQSHERLMNSRQTFEKDIADKQENLKDGFRPWLLSLHKKITCRLKMGIYEVDEVAEVGVIFEVMNNRGKGLTELEKVKNYLLYLSTKISVSRESSRELSEQLNKTWARILQRFMDANFGSMAEDQFLRAHWLIFHDYNRKNWNGSKSVKAKFNLRSYQDKNSELLKDLKNFVTSLDEGSIAFADSEKSKRTRAFNSFEDKSERQSVIFWSDKLTRIGTLASFRPLLMAIRLKLPNDARSYLELLKLLEKFAFRVYNMQGKRADTGQSSLYQQAHLPFSSVTETNCPATSAN